MAQEPSQQPARGTASRWRRCPTGGRRAQLAPPRGTRAGLHARGDDGLHPRGQGRRLRRPARRRSPSLTTAHGRDGPSGSTVLTATVVPCSSAPPARCRPSRPRDGGPARGHRTGSPSASDPAPAVVRNIRDVPGGGPTVLRIVLGQQLRRPARAGRGHARGRGRPPSGARTRRSAGWRTAAPGSRSATSPTCSALYGVHGRRRARADVRARRAARTRPGWWHRYSDLLPPWFETYVGLEQAADPDPHLRAPVRPGPAADRGDGAARHRRSGTGRCPTTSWSVASSSVSRRQRVLDAEDPPTLWAVVDEAALRRLTRRAPR